eukprot:g1354.t1
MFKGSIPALITPFKDGALDEKRFQELVDWQIAEGSSGLVPVGTTGESPTLTHDEHKRVVELCVEASGKRVPVIAGAGSNNTIEAIDFAQHAEKAGADAILVVTPYYNKPNQAGLKAHFKAINDAVGIPILIYNIPGRSIIDMTPETMAELFETCDNIVGVKDATADMAKASRQRHLCGPEFVQLSGEDISALAFNAHGGTGCISVTANVAPRLCAEFQAATLAGDFKKALEYQDRLAPLHRALFLEPSPGGSKYALSLLGKIDEELRLPLLPISEGAREEARFNFEIEDTLEAGIELKGTEVKSLRNGKANIAESYAAEYGGEIWIYNVYIPEYLQANRFNHEPRRPRKLLLHKREIGKLAGAVQKEGKTIVPLKLYFNEQGRAKLELALARGKKLHDKRETEKKRDWQREKSRIMKNFS